MTTPRYFSWSIGLSAAGALFAGYLSGVKLLTQGCAFDEPCPYFLGYPACYYGFAMFLALLALAFLGRAGKLGVRDAALSILLVAALGTLFAGRFVVEEVAGWFASGGPVLYGFGLPTCMYGLVFYVALLSLSASFLKKKT